MSDIKATCLDLAIKAGHRDPEGAIACAKAFEEYLTTAKPGRKPGRPPKAAKP